MSEYGELQIAKAIALLAIGTTNNHNGIDWHWAKRVFEGADQLLKEIDRAIPPPASPKSDEYNPLFR